MQTTTREFLEKLRTLLEEYDATLSFTYDGDTYGIHDEDCLAEVGGESISLRDFGTCGTFIDTNGIAYALSSNRS